MRELRADPTVTPHGFVVWSGNNFCGLCGGAASHPIHEPRYDTSPEFNQTPGGPFSQVEILAWCETSLKGNLRGVVDIRLPALGLTIRDCRIEQSAMNGDWTVMPPMSDRLGRPTVELEPQAAGQFIRAVLAAVSKYHVERQK